MPNLLKQIVLLTVVLVVAFYLLGFAYFTLSVFGAGVFWLLTYIPWQRAKKEIAAHQAATEDLLDQLVAVTAGSTDPSAREAAQQFEREQFRGAC